MEAVYDLLMTYDFPDVVTGGLRHRVDQLRGVLERTRGDVTQALLQGRLLAALRHDPPSASIEKKDGGDDRPHHPGQ